MKISARYSIAFLGFMPFYSDANVKDYFKKAQEKIVAATDKLIASVSFELIKSTMLIKDLSNVPEASSELVQKLKIAADQFDQSVKRFQQELGPQLERTPYSYQKLFILSQMLKEIVSNIRIVSSVINYTFNKIVKPFDPSAYKEGILVAHDVGLVADIIDNVADLVHEFGNMVQELEAAFQEREGAV